MAKVTGFGKTATLAALFLVLLSLPARGEESWQATFEQTCSRSAEAMNLSVDELRGLLQKASDLEKVIDKQEASVRKVYLKRLQLCRNLYSYMLEYKMGLAQK